MTEYQYDGLVEVIRNQTAYVKALTDEIHTLNKKLTRLENGKGNKKDN